MLSKAQLTFGCLVSASLTGAPAVAQPVAQGGRPFTAALTGAAEAPGPGDPDGSGTVKITLNPGQERICYEMSVTGVDGITAAHIHEAPVGEPGPVVVPLFTSGFDEEDCIEDLSRELIRDIIMNPQDYYVNVHSTANPAGAIRGQLSR